MDPDANLKQQLELVNWILEDRDFYYDEATPIQLQAMCEKADQLAELVQGLHWWLARGGALPEQWKGKR